MNTAAALHRRAALGRADLVLLLAEGVLPAPAAAALCGFVPRPREAIPAPEPWGIPLPPDPAPAVAAASPSASTPARLRATHFQVTQTEATAGDGVAPLADGEVLKTLPQSNPDRPPPALVPLWPEGALRRLLRRSLRAPLATAQLDTRRWITQVCRGEPLPARPPLRYRPSWRGATALFIHASHALRVINADLQAVVHHALRSSAGVAQVYWLDEEGQCWSAHWCGERRPPRWRRIGFAAAAAKARHWLWLGAAAALEPASGGRWWPRLRQHLQRGGRIVWLRPGPALLRPLRGVPVQRWERPALPDAHTGDMAMLLAALALAVRVEPVLLRALRRALGLPVQAEIEVWSHADVAAHGAMACTLKAERLAHYRDQARQLPAALGRRLAALIAEHHRHLSPLILNEEAALAFDLVGPGSAQPGGEDDPGDWRRVASTLYQGSPLSPELAAYVQRTGRRAHASLWARVPALAQAWVLANKTAVQDGAPLPAGMPAGVVSPLLGVGPGSLSQYWLLQQRGTRLLLVPEGAASRNPPLARLALPAGSASGVYLEQAGQGRWLALEQVAADLGELPPGQSLRLQSPGLCTTAALADRPEWAWEWGRDGQGLYVLLPPLGPWQQRFASPLAADTVFGTPRRLSARVALVFGVDQRYGPFLQLTVGQEVQTLRWVPPGEFWMGSPEEEGGDSDERPRHRVRHTEGFWLADTACTQALWLAVVGGDSPSRFADDAQGPVENVSWDQVQAFLQELSAQLGAGVVAELPTEAQWEYACRAGRETAFAFGATVTPAQVNYNGNYPYGDAPVGQYRERTLAVKALAANAWGFFQMHGNVWEWCADGLRDYAAASDEVIDDPRGPEGQGETALRALRGGSWLYYARRARSAIRSFAGRGERFGGAGFRFALRSSSRPAAGRPLEGD